MSSGSGAMCGGAEQPNQAEIDYLKESMVHKPWLMSSN